MPEVHSKRPETAVPGWPAKQPPSPHVHRTRGMCTARLCLQIQNTLGIRQLLGQILHLLCCLDKLFNPSPTQVRHLHRGNSETHLLMVLRTDQITHRILSLLCSAQELLNKSCLVLLIFFFIIFSHRIDTKFESPDLKAMVILVRAGPHLGCWGRSQ